MADTEELVKCGVCGLPLNLRESGVRSFGFYKAHSEARCVSLLRAVVEERTRELEEARESLLDAHRALDNHGIPTRDDLNNPEQPPLLSVCGRIMLATDMLVAELVRAQSAERLVDELVGGLERADAEFAALGWVAEGETRSSIRSLLSRARERKGSVGSATHE